MFVAHLPAGYILSSFFKGRSLKAMAMIGSVIPDLDLLYFYSFGGRAVVHHKYWTHMPVFWLGVFAMACLIIRLRGWKYFQHMIAFFAGTILHLALDSFIGSIYWLYPFSDLALTFFTVPARYDVWQLNFILHWTFLCEMLICVFAAYLYLQRRGKMLKSAGACF